MSHPVDVHVGKRLRLRRNLLGISQDDLGKSVSITSQQVQKYERCINRISCSRLYEFGEKLGVTIDYFFDGFSGLGENQGLAEGQAAYGMAENVMSKKETADLINTYYKISDKKSRQHILSIIKVMASQEN